jgi:penicillin-binding protein 1A
LRADASLALGTSEVTLVELTGAYGVLANGGRALEPHLIRRVRTGTGRVLFERQEPSPKMLVTPTHAAAMTDMLRAVLTSGTAKRAALPNHPAAGKTGTSQDFRDAWFVGYSGQFVAGVRSQRRWHPMNGDGRQPAGGCGDAMLAALDNRAPTAATVAARGQPTGANAAAAARGSSRNSWSASPPRTMRQMRRRRPALLRLRSAGCARPGRRCAS